MDVTLQHRLGYQAETVVAVYLEQQGYTICERNFRVKQGEIDIIARKAEVMAFVEVKARTVNYFNLSQVILPAKQRRIIYAARRYLSVAKQLHDTIIRFDVALLTRHVDTWDVTYLPNAFTDTAYF